MTKICAKCGKEKPIDEFQIKKNGRPHSYCDKCRKEGMDEWRKNNKEHIDEYRERTSEYRKQKDAEYRELHREELRVIARIYNNKHKAKLREYYRTHKEESSERRKKWVEQNREKYNAYFRKKRKIDINYRIAHSLRTRINKVLRGTTKYYTLTNVVGCSLDELKKWIEDRFIDGMTWSNQGQAEDKWNIDHIIPLASFDLSDPEQQKKAFHYTNLQPMWTNDNISKGAKHNGIDYKNKKSQ